MRTRVQKNKKKEEKRKIDRPLLLVISVTALITREATMIFAISPFFDHISFHLGRGFKKTDMSINKIPV